MHILYPRLGRHPTKGWIDYRWKYTGQRGFVMASGPFPSPRALWRAIKWFFGRRRRPHSRPIVRWSK